MGLARRAIRGAAAGAVATYASIVPAKFQDPGSGTAFGAMIWLAGYEGWLPTFGILPPAHKDRPGRAASVYIGHLVYGWTLGWAARRMQRKKAERAEE